jgi:hypothetical protein
LIYIDNIYAMARILNTFHADRNKKRIVDEGGVGTLVRILKSGDIKLQNEAVGALRNLSFLGA